MWYKIPCACVLSAQKKRKTKNLRLIYMFHFLGLTFYVVYFQSVGKWIISSMYLYHHDMSFNVNGYETPFVYSVNLSNWNENILHLFNRKWQIIISFSIYQKKKRIKMWTEPVPFFTVCMLKRKSQDQDNFTATHLTGE